MDSQNEWKTAQINTPLARSFRSIISAGWANRSNGEVDSLFGHFALVLIEPNELQELTDACLEEDDVKPYPGSYLVVEDSDGNTSLHEYLHHKAAEAAFERLTDVYVEWTKRNDAEKMYLVCANCGEAFDEIETAHKHGASDPNTKSWCGEDGFSILPGSEAL